MDSHAVPLKAMLTASIIGAAVIAVTHFKSPLGQDQSITGGALSW